MRAFATLILLLAARVPAAPAAQVPGAAPAALPSVPAAAGDPGDGRDRESAGAEEALESALLPRPLSHEAILGIAADLGIPDGERESIVAIERLYAGDTAAAHGKAVAEVRRRIAASTRAGPVGGALVPVDCPERVEMLTVAGEWRQVLVAADRQLLERLSALRTDAGTACNGLVACRRADSRDGAPSEDPLAALSLQSLIDAAGFDATDRRRVEDALDREWRRLAAAIEERRRQLDGAELARAKLQESWGPAWRIGLPPTELSARESRLADIDAQVARADEPMRVANREAAVALLKLLGTAAADRVRDAADRALWPWLFTSDARLASAVGRAAASAGGELAGHLRDLMRELDTRLAASRRELGRRASEAEAAAADDDEVSTRASATARLQAAVRLLEMRRRRLRAVAEACARMVHAAANDDRTKPALADLLASLQAERRALEWELDGTLARLAALGADVPPMGDGEEPPSQHAGDAGR